MKNKKIVIISFITLLIILIIFLILKNIKKEYEINLYYMDTYILVKLYSNKDTSKILNEVDSIYSDYHQLTDRFNHYDNIINVYDIHNNNYSTNELELDSRLYNILKYASDWHLKYPKFSIEMGDVIDVWKKYRDNQNGIPTIDELNSANNNTKLQLLGNNKILNNHPNLDLGAVAKGYATEEVSKYLESVGINNYLINAGGNVKVGTNYKKKYYNVGIQSPVAKDDLVTVIKCNNKSVVTSGGYERNYEYNNQIYHHIIDPDTLYPSNNMKSVSVITNDSALGDLLSTTLFLSSIDEGLNIIKEYDAAAIWYTNDNKLFRSENFSNYE